MSDGSLPMPRIYDEFRAIVGSLSRSKVAYAIVGGLAVGCHGHRRTTKDIDILTTADAADAAAAIIDAGCFESVPPRTFTKSAVTLRRFMKTFGPQFLLVDLLVGLDARHESIVGSAVVFRSRDQSIPVASAESLIWMKQQRGSPTDRGDIETLRELSGVGSDE